MITLLTLKNGKEFVIASDTAVSDDTKLYYYNGTTFITGPKLSQYQVVNKHHKDYLIELDVRSIDDFIDKGLYETDQHVVVIANKLEFAIPKSKIARRTLDFLVPGRLLDLPYQHFGILRRAIVPYTYYHVRRGYLSSVVWLIQDDEGNILDACYYPFNVSSRNVCSPMRFAHQLYTDNNDIIWYSEIPSTDILSLRREEYLPILLYALKSGSHELIPLVVETVTNLQQRKVTVKVNITINDRLYSDVYALSISKKLYDYICRRYDGDKIVICDTISVDTCKSE